LRVRDIVRLSVIKGFAGSSVVNLSNESVD